MTNRVYTIGGRKITVSESLNPDFGNYTWASAKLLAARLAFEVETRQLDLSDAHVLELGCGTALPGLLAASCGAPSVFLTDAEAQLQDADGLARLQRAAAMNQVAERVTILPWTWGQWTDQILALPAISLILAADCLYALQDYDPFFAAASFLLHHGKPGARMLMAYCDRVSGRSFEPFMWKWKLEYEELSFSGLPEEVVEEAGHSLRLLSFKSRSAPST